MEQAIHYININGNLLSTDQTSFVSSKKITEPDSLFESLRYYKGEVLLEEYHANRLQKGLIYFGYPIEGFQWKKLTQEIAKLLAANKLHESARIRLAIQRANNRPEFVVESWAVGKYSFDRPGKEIDVFNNETKSIDEVANLKKGNHLSYLSAPNYAKEHQIDDVLILNAEGRICESTVSNIFWIKNGVAHTIPLSEGPVAGVLREYLLKKTEVKEERCRVQDLLEADEIFLTNMIRGIQPVRRFRTSTYPNTWSKLLFKKFIEPLTR